MIPRSFVLAAPLAIALLSGCAASMPASLPHSLVGGPAPHFYESSMGDRDVGVPGGPRTKVTIVDFWASWCDGCQQSIPVLEAVHRDLYDDGVRVIGVSVDASKDDAIAMAFRLRTTFPVIHDGRMRIAGNYRIANVPITFVIDRRGVVRWVGRDPSDARRAAKAILAEDR